MSVQHKGKVIPILIVGDVGDCGEAYVAGGLKRIHQGSAFTYIWRLLRKPQKTWDKHNDHSYKYFTGAQHLYSLTDPVARNELFRPSCALKRLSHATLFQWNGWRGYRYFFTHYIKNTYTSNDAHLRLIKWSSKNFPVMSCLDGEIVICGFNLQPENYCQIFTNAVYSMWLYTIWPLYYPAVKTEELSNSASRWWVSQKNLTCKWPINTFPLLIAFLKFDATASSIAAWRFAASRILSDDQWFLYLLSRWQCFSSLCGPSLLGVTLFFKSPKRLEEDHTLRWCGLKLLFGEMWYDFLRKSRLRPK